MIRDEVGLTLDKADKDVLGHAAKVVLTKDFTTIVGDGSTQEAVVKRVAQIKNLIEVSLVYTHVDLQVLLEVDFHSLFELRRCLFGLFIIFDQVAEQEYEKEKLNERIAKLSGGVAVIQVFAVSLMVLQFYYIKFSWFSSDCI